MARAAWRMPGYRVEELLGAGSTGEVWRGRLLATGAGVALKRVWLSDRIQRKAALSEAAMLASLDHPHLVKLHEVRHVDDDIVLVLDLASGGSLGSLLARRGRLTVGEAITAIAPIGAALAYAHSAGVVHGDVSAANILFTEIGLPLLADLGVARLLDESTPVRTTPCYADPLVASGALPGPESDVFMLGGVALHTLTGSPPWPGTVSAEVLDAAASGAQPDFAARLARAGVPEFVAAVVARVLSIEPAQRGTAADFALELRHAGQPVAVELTAGRARVLASSSGRGSSWPLESVPSESVRPGSVPPGSVPAAGLGPDAEPVRVPEFVGEQPLTYGVRAPSPFAGAGRHHGGGRPRVTTGLAVGAVLALLAIVAAVLWWPSGQPVRHSDAAPAARSASAPRPAPKSRPPLASRSASAAGRAASPRSSTSVPTLPRSSGSGRRAPSIAAILAHLDSARSAAFARRDPALLATVYDSPQLLARDRALLLSIVPSGCGLRGVHTRFTRPAVLSRTAGRVRVRVTAAIAPSTLVCGGTDSGRAAGVPRASLLVDLVHVADSYRIAASVTRG